MSIKGDIYLRLFLPFSFALLLAAIFAWWTATNIIEGTLEQRLEGQLKHAASVLAEGSVPLTPELLRRLGHLLQADIVLIRSDGSQSFTTLAAHEAPLGQAVGAVIKRYTNLSSAVGVPFVFQQIPYLTVISPITDAHDQRYNAVAMVASLEEVHQASLSAAWRLGGAAFVSILILAILGHFLARGITGPVKELALMASRIASGDRSVRAMLKAGNEIGELAQALNEMTEKLAVYEEEVARSSRLAAVGQTAARVAHEIRNPLTAIKMQIQLLHEAVGPQQQGITRSLLGEVQRLELIVASTLDLSRPAQLNCAPTDLNELVLELTRLLAPQLEHRGIHLDIHRANSLPPALIDSNRVKQVLLNLLVNAADALPDGGKILLETTYNASGKSIGVMIEDSGPGIPPEKMARLFTPLQTDKPGGFGLGLSLSKELIELHGGHIDVDSGTLGGARFRVWFPQKDL